MDEYDLKLIGLIRQCKALGIKVGFAGGYLPSGKPWLSPDTPPHIKNDPVAYLENKISEHSLKTQVAEPATKAEEKHKMNFPKKILIIDCFPQGFGVREAIINKVSKYYDLDYVTLENFESDKQLTNFLINSANLDHEIVHINSRGNRAAGGHNRGLWFEVSDTTLLARDFPRECFRGKVIIMAADWLGDWVFAVPFMRQTGAGYLMAPTSDLYVSWANSFYKTFYYVYAQTENADVFQTYEYLLKHGKAASRPRSDPGIQFYKKHNSGSIERYLGFRLTDTY